jgi:hypothetical protein
LLEDGFFAPLLQALQTPGITRECAAVDDASFVTLAVLRVLENSKTGRDFIQTHGIPITPGLTRSILPRIKICGKEVFPLMTQAPIMFGSSNDRNSSHRSGNPGS